MVHMEPQVWFAYFSAPTVLEPFYVDVHVGDGVTPFSFRRLLRYRDHFSAQQIFSESRVEETPQ